MSNYTVASQGNQFPPSSQSTNRLLPSVCRLLELLDCRLRLDCGFVLPEPTGDPEPSLNPWSWGVTIWRAFRVWGWSLCSPSNAPSTDRSPTGHPVATPVANEGVSSQHDHDISSNSSWGDDDKLSEGFATAEAWQSQWGNAGKHTYPYHLQGPAIGWRAVAGVVAQLYIQILGRKIRKRTTDGLKEYLRSAHWEDSNILDGRW